ncbi:hemerythrin domain-containing protein [Novispirillum sp. DQ9]|uniref:hemerythrin domain-containing protein n=1 Tax=Novispirillum sp. DQ9 TaxID=3398612 RepID=UPI003C7A6555
MTRYNMYRLIHKGVRALTAGVLVDFGRLDAADDAERAALVARVRDLLDFCHHHMDNEDRHVHPAMEARAPGSTAAVAADHVHHLHGIESLRAACDRLEAAAPAARAEAAHALYLELAVFVGENMVHMNVEETANNAVLWRCYSDAELQGIEAAIVASLAPPDMAQTLRWMVPSATPAERADFLLRVRAMVPTPVFADILGMVTPHLGAIDRAKLDAALAPRATAAA